MSPFREKISVLRQHVTRRCLGLARVALPAASLLWSVQVLAQRQTDVSAPVAQLSTVTVTSSMGSVQGNYKNFLNGYHAFVEKHEYAANSRLEFHVDDASASDGPLQLKFETKSSYEDVPLDEDNNFELPIRQDDALLHGGLLANRPKGSVDVQPLVRSPGERHSVATLGELRLECVVSWAISKGSASVFVKGLFLLGGGVCHSRKIEVYLYSPSPLASATLSDGKRTETLRIGRNNHWYAVPVSDKSFANSAVVTYEYVGGGLGAH